MLSTPPLSALSLPISDPKMSGPGPANNISPTYVDHDLWMNYNHNHGCYPGSEIDQALDTSQMADKYMPFMTLDTIPLSIPHTVPGIASPTESISTPGLEWGSSSCSTPSTMYLGSPLIGEQTLLGLGGPLFNQAAKTKRLVSDQSRKSRTMSVATRSNQTTLHLLQTFKFSQGQVLEEE